MPLDVRKYLGDTMHLGREHHGAYLLLIMAYWMRGGPLTDSDQELAAIVRASQPDWRRLRPVIQPFFEVRDCVWVHHKIEKELERARGIIATKSESGRKGAEKRWQKDSKANGKRMADQLANGKETDAPVPVPVPKKEQKEVAALRAVAAPQVEIPDWIPPEAWAGFVEMRKKIRLPLTDRGALLTIAALKKLRATEDIGAVLDQSTMKNYRGVFPVKHEGNGNGNRSKSPSAHDKFNAGVSLFIDSLGPDADEGGEGAIGGDIGPARLPLLAS